MTVEEFDKEINATVDSFLVALKAHKELLEARITKACEAADAAKLPAHLCIASVTAAMARMEAEGQ